MAETLGMTVTAWSPLADGILSGKFTRTSTVRNGLVAAGRDAELPG